MSRVEERDVAALDRLLTTTRSVRRRLDLSRPVEPEIVEACLEVAVPNGGNANPYHFVVTDAATRTKVASV